MICSGEKKFGTQQGKAETHRKTLPPSLDGISLSRPLALVRDCAIVNSDISSHKPLAIGHSLLHRLESGNKTHLFSEKVRQLNMRIESSLGKQPAHHRQRAQWRRLISATINYAGWRRVPLHAK
jgi:hypothetical protein